MSTKMQYIGVCTLMLLLSPACATTKKDTTSKDGQVKPQVPLLTRPEVKNIYVPDKISADGTKWEQGHYIFFIDKQSTFSQ